MSSDTDLEYYLDNEYEDYDDDLLDVEVTKYNHRFEEIKELSPTNFNTLIPKYIALYDELIAQDDFDLSHLEDINNLIIHTIKKILAEFIKTNTITINTDLDIDDFNECTENINELTNTKTLTMIQITIDKYNDIYNTICSIKIYDTIEKFHIALIDVPLINLLLVKTKVAISENILTTYNTIMLTIIKEIDAIIEKNITQFTGYAYNKYNIGIIDKITKAIMPVTNIFSETPIAQEIIINNDVISEKIETLKDIMEHHSPSNHTRIHNTIIQNNLWQISSIPISSKTIAPTIIPSTSSITTEPISDTFNCIMNNSAKSYVSFENFVTRDFVREFCTFLFDYKVWKADDSILPVPREKSYLIDQGWSNISYVIGFYNTIHG